MSLSDKHARLKTAERVLDQAKRMFDQALDEFHDASVEWARELEFNLDRAVRDNREHEQTARNTVRSVPVEAQERSGVAGPGDG